MAVVSRAEATWSGSLVAGSGEVSAVSSQRLHVAADHLGRAHGGPRRADEPRGAGRGRARRVLLDGVRVEPDQGRDAADATRGRRGRSPSTSSRPAGRWPRARSPCAGRCPGSRRPTSRRSPRRPRTAARSAGPSRATWRSASRRPSRADRSADRQQPARVRHGHRLDLGLGDAGLAQPRQERLGEVGVAVAAVARQLRVVAHVLAEQDRSTCPRASSSHRRSMTRASPWRSCGRERHPEEVELHARAALDDREVVVEDRVGVGVPDDDARRVGALRPRRSRSWSSPTGESTAWVVIASPVRRAARATARWTRSSWAESHGLSVPISPMMPGPHAALPHPVGRSRATSSSARSSTDRRSMRASAG